jgi:uncharacterized protein
VITTPTGIQGITEQDIANYLANNPVFFEQHAELLASVQLTSPHGKRAVSLQERQMELLRDKHKGLEQRIMEMVRHAQDNLSLADKLHRWVMAMLLTPDAAQLPEVLVAQLQHQFLIPQAGIRVWGAAPTFDRPFAYPVSEDAQSLASSLASPYCGVNSGFEACSWLQEPQSVTSVALIALRKQNSENAFGMLVLASPDPTRYSVDMGLDFLVRVGELASAALSGLLLQESPPQGG